MPPHFPAFSNKTLLGDAPKPPAKKRRTTCALEEPLILRAVQVRHCDSKEDRLVVEIEELQDKFTNLGSLSHHDRTRLGMALVTYLSHVVKIPEKKVRIVIKM